MQKLNKHTVLKAARDKGYWSGYIAGNKVSEYHIAGGWGLGLEITIQGKQIEGVWAYTARQSNGNRQPLENLINSMLYYQDKELGNSVSFWDENKSEMAVYSDGE